MAKIELDFGKTIEENAALYFEKAKKAKKKLEGVKEALERSRAKLKQLEIELEKEKKEKQKMKEETAEKIKKAKEKKWYEKFRWFVSSEGFLCVGGRDATTNEILIKKHTSSEDVVFHTDLAGSPFFVIKTEGKTPGEPTMQETAQATASFSRAWKLGLNTLEVFHVKPEQVSKKAKTGEYLNKGAFMIYGRTEYITAEIKLAVGIKDEKIMCAAPEAVKKHCEKYVLISQGREKPSDAAKKIKKILGGDLDEIIRALPSGGIEVKP